MSGANSIFSESWYLVADVHCSLRSSVRIQRQVFHGEIWYVLSDRFSNQFFRLQPEAYQFIARLNEQQSLDALWQQQLSLTPDETPGQQEVIQLLTQLNSANLLQFDKAADSEKLYQRHQQRKQRQRRSWLMSFLFVRIPLFDPDKLLTALTPSCRRLFGPLGLCLWLLVGLMGIRSVIDNSDQLFSQAQGILSTDNMLLLYLGLLLIKVFHELGHGIVCKHYGGEVHTTGVILLILMPLPYVDATASWRFSSRYQRAYVAAAGVLVELFLAAVAALVWANTAPGVANSLAYNIMFIASVSSLLFNANPLLKFDGYYVFSDLIQVPNLYNRSRQMLLYWCERGLYRLRDLVAPSHNTYEATWLTAYGLLATVYRLIITITIIGFVADQYLILGIIMALMLLATWLIVPPFKLTKYLISSPKHARHRKRSIGVTLGLLVLPLMLLALVPVTERFRAPGVVEATQFVHLSSQSSGQLVKTLVPSGDVVVKDQPVMQLENHELALTIKEHQAKLAELTAVEQRSLSQNVADLAPIRQRRLAIKARLDELQDQWQSLQIRASQDGIWIINESVKSPGSWLVRGQQVGMIIDNEAFRYTAVVSQEEASDLFQRDIQLMEVRLFGEPGNNIAVREFEIIPYQQQQLPTTALSWLGGGQVAVSADESGKQALEPFFQIVAQLDGQTQATLMHGRTGNLRVTLDGRPLLSQWWRSLQQFLQKRYQL